jgi:hypothetical protein
VHYLRRNPACTAALLRCGALCRSADDDDDLDDDDDGGDGDVPLNAKSKQRKGASRPPLPRCPYGGPGSALSGPGGLKQRALHRAAGVLGLAFEPVARADLTPSDVIASLRLLRAVQKDRERTQKALATVADASASVAIRSPAPLAVDPSDAQDDAAAAVNAAVAPAVSLPPPEAFPSLATAPATDSAAGVPPSASASPHTPPALQPRVQLRVDTVLLYRTLLPASPRWFGLLPVRIRAWLQRRRQTRRTATLRAAAASTAPSSSSSSRWPSSRWLQSNVESYPHLADGTHAFDASRPEELAALVDAAHYADFATGSYGWPMYVLGHPLTWCCVMGVMRVADMLRWMHYAIAAVVARGCCRRGRKGALSSAGPLEGPVGRWAAAGRLSSLDALLQSRGAHTQQAPRCNLMDPLGCNKTVARMWMRASYSADFFAIISAKLAWLGGAPQRGDSAAIAAAVLTSGAVSVESTPSSFYSASRASSVSAAAGPSPADGHTVQLEPSLPGPWCGTSAQPPSLLLLSSKNSFCRCPYMVSYDRARHTLVVTVRGTLSLEDAITDALAMPVPLTGDPTRAQALLRDAGIGHVAASDAFVHEGMWRAAHRLRAELMASGLLHAVARVPGAVPLEGPQGAGSAAIAGAPKEHTSVDLKGLNNDLASPLRAGDGFSSSSFGGAVDAAAQTLHDAAEDDGLKLIIVGHSLGAGVAGLLSLLLRPHFPDLRCFTYAPPAALVSPPLSAAMQAWTTSVLLGKDAVPRMSLATTSVMLRDALFAASRAAVHKRKITHKASSETPAASLLLPADVPTPVSPFSIACEAIQNELDVITSSVKAVMQEENGDTLGTTRGWQEKLKALLDAQAAANRNGADAYRADPRIQALETFATFHRTMMVPGKVLHFVKTARVNQGAPIYTPRWSRPENLLELQVSVDMLIDHFPDRLAAVCHAAVQDILLDDSQSVV